MRRVRTHWPAVGSVLWPSYGGARQALSLRAGDRWTPISDTRLGDSLSP